MLQPPTGLLRLTLGGNWSGDWVGDHHYRERGGENNPTWQLVPGRGRIGNVIGISGPAYVELMCQTDENRHAKTLIMVVDMGDVSFGGKGRLKMTQR